ncbi:MULTISPECIES: hypothetical protein [Mycobacteroides]|uniref:hypothetical protein n=1 Tax=Mycobacteroides TaxID=670516 RepID=UPI000A7F6B23|nr:MULTISPECIES: hypothetical protein [Mycobacteroides]
MRSSLTTIRQTTRGSHHVNDLLYSYTRSVRLRLIIAPWWVQAPVHAVLFFVLWALYSAATDSRPDWLQVAITALLFGLIMGPVSARRNRRVVVAVMAGVAPRDYRHISKTLRIGPPPSDPVMLRAAARLARMRAAQGMRERTTSMILMAACVVVMIALGEGHTFHAAGYLMAVLFGVLGAHSWFNPLLLQARSTILADAARQNISSMGLSGTVQPADSVRQDPESYPLENHPSQRDEQVLHVLGSDRGLLSFRGRMACAILVLVIGGFGLWAYFHYRDPEMF